MDKRPDALLIFGVPTVLDTVLSVYIGWIIWYVGIVILLVAFPLFWWCSPLLGQFLDDFSDGSYN